MAARNDHTEVLGVLLDRNAELETKDNVCVCWGGVGGYNLLYFSQHFLIDVVYGVWCPGRVYLVAPWIGDGACGGGDAAAEPRG